MKQRRNWWFRLCDLVLGRKWFVSVDPASTAGDYTASVMGYRDREGGFHIVSETRWPKNQSMYFSEEV